MRIDNAAPAFKNLGIPADSGLSVSLDLLLNPEAAEADAARTAELLKTVLGQHLEKELRTNRLCNGIRVQQAVNEADESRVLRVVLSYKRLVSIDGFLEHMLIPYKFADLVSVFVADFRSNLDLGSLLSKSRNLSSLSETFAGSVSRGIELGSRALWFETSRRPHVTLFTVPRLFFLPLLHTKHSLETFSLVLLAGAYSWTSQLD